MVKRAGDSLHQIFTEESLLTQFCLGPTFSSELNLFNNRKSNASAEYFRSCFKIIEKVY
ncbi:MAG: hypothetical protein ACRCZZ_01525 [Phocaeicola sp.]